MKELNEESNQKISHDGHRDRVRKKVAKFGLRSLELHELLEFLLWYAIPRKDTNPTGHALAKKFGTLSNVLNADPKFLATIDGVGEKAAQFLTMLPELFNIYKESMCDANLDVLNSVNECVRYFRHKFEINKHEDFYIICMSGTNKVIKYEKLKGANDMRVDFDPNHFTTFINDPNVVSVLICHTHPLGQTLPSLDDLATTKTIIQICQILHKNLVDHLVFNETGHYSFATNGILANLAEQVVSTMGDQTAQKMRSRKVTPFSYLDTEEISLIADMDAILHPKRKTFQT